MNQKSFTIQNQIKNVPKGMELKERSYYLYTIKGILAKVFKRFKKPSERFGVLRIMSLIRHYQMTYNEGDNAFVNIGCHTLIRTAGWGFYKTAISWLIELGYIEENSIYCVNNFSKSFKFIAIKFVRGFEVVNWNTEGLSYTDDGYAEAIDGITFTPDGRYDAELLYCLENERRLSVPNEKEIVDEMVCRSANDEDMLNVTKATYWFEDVNSGNFIPSQQRESTRFYFPSIMMPSGLRKHLRYNKATTLVNFDIKTAYPVFIKLIAMGGALNNNYGITGQLFDIYSEASPKVGASKINEFYNIDFYSRLLEVTNYNSRDAIKTAFNKFRNSAKELQLKHPLYQAMVDIGEPEMLDIILKTDWKVLEQIETDFVVALCNRCIDADLVFIRAHDGFLTIPQDVAEIEAVLTEHPFNLLLWKKEDL